MMKGGEAVGECGIASCLDVMRIGCRCESVCIALSYDFGHCSPLQAGGPEYVRLIRMK